jgi:hypothetical protein
MEAHIDPADLLRPRLPDTAVDPLTMPLGFSRKTLSGVDDAEIRGARRSGDE